LFFGSAQAQVPVKPVCPKVSGEQFLPVGVGLLAKVSGLSKPSPLLYSLLCLLVNSATVVSLKILTPP
jgi:hypothetical protein